jgi:hypothetical protein
MIPIQFLIHRYRPDFIFIVTWALPWSGYYAIRIFVLKDRVDFSGLSE